MIFYGNRLIHDSTKSNFYITKFTNLQIVGDLSVSTTCNRQLLECCYQLTEGVSRCWSLIPFFQRRTLSQTGSNSKPVWVCLSSGNSENCLNCVGTLVFSSNFQMYKISFTHIKLLKVSPDENVFDTSFVLLRLMVHEIVHKTLDYKHNYITMLFIYKQTAAHHCSIQY